MNKVKIMSVLMLTAVLTACSSGTGTPCPAPTAAPGEEMGGGVEQVR